MTSELYGETVMPPTDRKNILFTGATGYIGGSVLARLLDDPKAQSYAITTIVRLQDKAIKLGNFGNNLNVVVGSHSDATLVEKLAAASDIVIATADADSLEAAQAILRGLKKRYEHTKEPAILIHTSGTGVLSDDAKGLTSTFTVYNDLDVAQLDGLAPTQLHRNVDLELLKADAEGYVKTYIVLPSTIYGMANHKLTEAGIAKVHSLQIPSLIQASLDRGRAGMIGKGANLWPDVHIDDIANLYVTLFDAILTHHPAAKHGREGFYFGENGEHSLYEVGKAIGEALVKVGLSKPGEEEPTTFNKDEVDKFFEGSEYLGSNSRCKANRAREVGWKPKYTKQDLLESIFPEVVALRKDPSK